MPRWLKQLASYIISFVVLTYFFHSYEKSLILLGAIAFHECGHLYAAKMMGLRTKGFYLIPFIGGAALIADRYKRYSQMSFVVLAGPITGALGAVAFYGLYLATGSTFLGCAACLMAALNLFNLIPLAMLDGGQIVESIVYSINEVFGAGYLTLSYALGIVIIWQFNPFVAGMMTFIGVPVVLAAWRSISLTRQGLQNLLPPKPDRMDLKELVLTILVYASTAAVLLGTMYLCHSSHLFASNFFSKHF